MGGFRRSELINLNYEDIERDLEGLKIIIKKSKTDQKGLGNHKKGIRKSSIGEKYCPVVSYENWIKISNINSIGIFGHSFGSATSFYSAYHNSKIKSCFGLDGWFEPMPDTLITKNIDKPIFHIGQNNKGEIKYWNDLNYKKMETIMHNNSNLSIIIDIPGSYHYDYTDFTYFTHLSKKMGFSGSVASERMAEIMNTTLLDFFN